MSNSDSNQPPLPKMLKANSSNPRSTPPPALSDLYLPVMAEDRHHNFNRQSGKVNHGLDFGGAPSSDEDMQSSFDTPNPPLGIEFSTLIVPPVAPEPKITIKQLVAKLMNPSAHAFVYGVLSIGWVVGVAGYEHFEGKGADVQFSLRPESPLRKYGRKLGIPAGYHEWLCGDEDGTSATECGMMLTPEFFINEV